MYQVPSTMQDTVRCCGDKKKEDDYVMSASWTANGFNYVVYAEKYVHMDELKQLVVDVMESEEYKAGK